MDDLLDPFDEQVEVVISRFETPIYTRIGATPQRVNVGAIKETWVAALAMQAEAEGRLAIDEPIGSYLSDLVGPVTQVTVASLLNHTSGVQFNNQGQPQSELTSPVGAVSHYQPENYQLICQILERLYRKDITDLIQTRILDPLQLQVTQVQDGAWLSSTEDLDNWLASINSNQINQLKSHLAMFKARRLADGSYAPYGFAWEIGERHGMRLERAWSQEQGNQVLLLRFPEKTWTATLTATDCECDLRDLSERIIDIYLERERRGGSRTPSTAARGHS